MLIDIPSFVDRLCYRYPSFLVDSVIEHDPGRRLVAVKNVTVNEEFFQGHFPGSPLMPGVLMIESLAQAASLLVLYREGRANASAVLRGVNDAKFRRQVVPGDRVRLEVTRGAERGRVVRVHGLAYVEDQVVAEAELVLAVVPDPAQIDPSAAVDSGAELGEGVVIESQAVVGARVTLGRGCRVGAHAVIDGWTEIGEGTEIFPFASIGLIPQDLKFKGEQTRLVIGRRNIFREFVTIHRGTAGGGGLTWIGDHNVFMAYTHVAHDCRVGNHTILANGATLGGHVLVEDWAFIGALSGVHQFCRVGQHAFIGGGSVVTKDALPFGRTVGNRAHIYGLNTIGLMRRGFAPEVLARLKRTYRYLLQSKLNTTHALGRIESDSTLDCPEVRYLVEFIRSSPRGVILRRAARRAEEMVVDE